MLKTLKTLEPDNPYLHLLEAVRQAVRELPRLKPEARPPAPALQPSPEGGIR
jgi:nitrate reductase delta subunit